MAFIGVAASLDAQAAGTGMPAGVADSDVEGAGSSAQSRRGRPEDQAAQATRTGEPGGANAPQHIATRGPIPPEFLDLVTTKKAFANLATVMLNGGPQVTPVWFDFDGKYLRVNSARGRVKDKNMRRDPRVALSIRDPDNPYRA